LTAREEDFGNIYCLSALRSKRERSANDLKCELHGAAETDRCRPVNTDTTAADALQHALTTDLPSWRAA